VKVLGFTGKEKTPFTVTDKQLSQLNLARKATEDIIAAIS